MHFLHLFFLSCVVSFFSNDRALESPADTLNSINANPITTNDVVPGATNIILQSKDGGQTWKDITPGLPENQQPVGFFVGESDVYLRFKNDMYRSESNLQTPVWEKEIVDPQFTSIAFNRSGVVGYNHEGKIYQKVAAIGTWMPIYTSFKSQSVETIFETSDGTVFVGCRNGLYKSTDRGLSWKHVINEGWVMDLVESEGVLIGTHQNGIMRSTDNGEHWEWVISEGGVGIAVERIDGGFAAIAANTTTMSRRIYISLDRGETWKTIDEGLQPSLSVSSIKQMGYYLICGHPDGIFRSSDMGKTWNIVMDKTWNIIYSGVDKKVYEIYASGNTLYAVARSSGC